MGQQGGGAEDGEDGRQLRAVGMVGVATGGGDAESGDARDNRGNARGFEAAEPPAEDADADREQKDEPERDDGLDER